jgi:hypothetical protein
MRAFHPRKVLMSIEAHFKKLLNCKLACALMCCLILLSNIWTISRWNESRGVYDDICYLRQAHLFQQFGVDGLNTDIARDDDHYLALKLKEIGFAAWKDPAAAPCHSLMRATGRRVMQYPPGTGFVLALFPSGFQVIPLYIASTIIVFGFALLGIFRARATWLTLLAGAIGGAAIYLTINPAKASYSMAPTLAACALAGFLTARAFVRPQHGNGIGLVALLGLVLGLSVDFRLPNLFLSAAYFLNFLVCFVASRSMRVFLQGAAFTFAYLIGMAPTLIANAINAGSPFATTYGGPDVVGPEFASGVVWQYATDMQFALLAVVCASTIFHLYMGRAACIRQVALMVTINLTVSLGFFLSHPLFTSYYTVPVSMLSLWTLLFNWLMQPALPVEDGAVTQAAAA